MTVAVRILRSRSEDWGTPGKLSAIRSDAATYACDSLELPWAQNERGRSCVVADTYAGKPYVSAHLGSPHHRQVARADGSLFDLYRTVYKLEDKHGRTDCELHNANFAGEVRLGEETQLHGCTALGHGFGELLNDNGVLQRAILSSVVALEEFVTFCRGEDIAVSYEWAEGCQPPDEEKPA